MRRVTSAGRLSVRLDTSLESLLAHAPRDAGPRVLATLVGTAGSTYRKPGARMLIMPDGHYLGLLSGGCLEADLGVHAHEVMTTGIARAVEYDMRGPDDVLFGLGAGCAGALRILLEPAGHGSRAATALTGARDVVVSGRATFLIAVHESADLALGTYDPARLPPALRAVAERVLEDATSHPLDVEGEGGRTRAFVHYLAPAPRLLVCGAGPDAQPVVSTALNLGWRVTVVDHRPTYATARRFPGAEVHHAAAHDLRAVSAEQCHAAVVMSHHLSSDVDYLRALAETVEPGYVGLLGPAGRRARIFQELGPAAVALRSRLRGPVGLDIGAVTPEGIALAIVSQIHAWLAGRAEPGSLPS